MRINRRSQEFRKLATHGIGLEYASQLSHYEAIARDAGVTVHAVALAAFDSRSFRVELIPHEEEPTLAEELRKACASFWDDFVLKGRLPPRLPEDLPLEPTPMAEATVFRLAALKAVMDALENARQAMTEDLQDLYAGTTGALATGLAPTRANAPGTPTPFGRWQERPASTSVNTPCSPAVPTRPSPPPSSSGSREPCAAGTAMV